MRKTEKNKLAMYRAIDAVIANHQESVDALAPLAEAVVSFRAALNTILERDREYLGVAAGATAAKNSALGALVDETMLVANALYAIGRKTDSEELKAQCRLNASDFSRLRENEIEQMCVSIHSLAQEHAEALVPYGISSGSFADYSGMLDNFRKQADAQQTKIAESKAARELLSDAFDAADDILREDIDRLIELVRKSDEELLIRYKAARTIRDLGGSHSTKNNGENGTAEVPQENAEAVTAA